MANMARQVVDSVSDSEATAVFSLIEAALLKSAVGPDFAGNATIKGRRKTFTACLYWLQLEGQSIAGAKKAWVAKITLPTLASAIRHRCEAEVWFYAHLGPTVGVPTINCHAAKWFPETKQGVLIFDDLSSSHYSPEWPVPPTDRDCERAVQYLAELHALWWQSPVLARKEFTTVARAGPVRLPGVGTCEVFATFLGQRLNGRDAKHWKEAALSLRRIDAALLKRRLTLVHGDAHGANFLFPRDKTATTILTDWQFVAIASPGCDLANMISVQWSPERRRFRGEALLRRYHNCLKECGVKTYDWSDLYDDFSLWSLRHCLAVPVWQWSNRVPASVWWPVVERGIAAWDDLGWGALLKRL